MYTEQGPSKLSKLSGMRGFREPESGMCSLPVTERYDHRKEKARKTRQKQNNNDRYAHNEFTKYKAVTSLTFQLNR